MGSSPNKPTPSLTSVAPEVAVSNVRSQRLFLTVRRARTSAGRVRMFEVTFDHSWAVASRVPNATDSKCASTSALTSSPDFPSRVFTPSSSVERSRAYTSSRGFLPPPGGRGPALNQLSKAVTSVAYLAARNQRTSADTYGIGFPPCLPHRNLRRRGV